jgi:hypothetical protein
MAFPGDWVTNKIDSGTLVVLEGATPIVGSGSLKINATVTTERVTLYNTTYTNGLTAGYIRSNMRIPVHSTTGEARAGFAFMQNVATINGVTDTGYAAFLSSDNGLTSPRIHVVKFTTGLPNSPTDLASTTSFTAPTIGSNFCFEVQWIADVGVFGGTQIIVRYCTGLSFASLVDVITVVDTSSPIITSSFETIAFAKQHTGTFQALYDETRIYELT